MPPPATPPVRSPDRPRQPFARAFVTAAAGLRDFSRERNSRVQLSAGGLAIALGMGIRLTRIEWALLLLTVTGVLCLEAVNCAIERVVDLASPGYHELARQAKDLAAGAVLLASIAAIFVGGLIYLPHLVTLVRSGTP